MISSSVAVVILALGVIKRADVEEKTAMQQEPGKFLRRHL